MPLDRRAAAAAEGEAVPIADEVTAALSRYLRAATGARSAAIDALNLLPNGAIHENWRLDATLTGGTLAGRRSLVLRKDAATTLGIGLDRAGEFAVLRAVHAAGVPAPEPLLFCADPSVIGEPFLVMHRLPGEATPERIVGGALGGDRAALIADLAGALAAIHRIPPQRAGFAALGRAPEDAARVSLAECAELLAGDADPHPVAEWGIRWLRRHAPPPVQAVLCHGDFRTGNFLADARGLTGILDWEFAHWSDPLEDLAWFCLGCWRFGAYAREAGGIAARAAFVEAYERASGSGVAPERLRWWEVLAALRWLVIALRQRDRWRLDGERSLDLVLTGRRPAECEIEILKLTEEA
jgi:aminoglycoside phosphotransferase (APT) family kinase protein